MGIFLRTWRSEWSALTRAQLAIAVSALCPKGQGVTPSIVREWEAGQPPNTTAHLAALLQVMQRKGLSGREVDDFRSVVLSAVACDRYPELFDTHGFANHPEVDALACALWERHGETPWLLNAAYLVAAVHDIERALRGQAVAIPPQQRRKQQVALVHLRALLAVRHGGCRVKLAAAAYAANADLLLTYFGKRGLGGHLSVLYQRVFAAYEAAHASKSTEWARRLLQLSDQARSADERLTAEKAFFGSLHCFGDAGERVYDSFRPQSAEWLDRIAAEQPPAHAHDAHHEMFWCALGEGLLGPADHHLEGMAPFACGSVDKQVEWHQAAGHLALRQGQRGEAADYFVRTLPLARAVGNAAAQRDVVRALGTCERTRKPVPRARAR